MNPDNGPEERLFESALELPAGPRREAFLDQACRADQALRKRVEALLQAHENPGTALEPEQLVGDVSGKGTIRLSFPDDEAVGTRIDRYKLLQKIGEGGMGVVYMAEQEEPVRRRVALKIIKLGMDTRQVVARFEAERQALALMDHPNIARVLDGGATESGRPYFVMELVQGVPITEFCDKNKLSARERLKLFIPICQAIQSAHQKGIIHRDLKPSNVLVTLNHGEPVPKVIDFGIAKATSQKLTEKTLFTNYGTMIGTPAYMSPEQAEMSSLDVDTRADVYSLGVLLYELLTGGTPFPEKRLRSLGYGEMQRVILEEEPERPSTRLSTMDQEQKTAVIKNRGEQGESLRNLLKGDLDWIVMKCLEKDQRRRYETANGLARDIERHLASELVTARPPSAAYKFQKAWQRNKIVFTAGAVVIAALVLGVSISTWQAVVATRAKAEAERARNESVKEKSLAEQSEKSEAAVRKEAEHQLYVARMNLAQQAWDNNNVTLLKQLLEDTKDSPYRGFEWDHWQQQTHLSLRTLGTRGASIGSVAYSPDGRRIVGACDREAKIWDVASGRELFALKGHRSDVSSVAFSKDGKQIVTASDDGTAKVWDAANGRVLRTFSRHSSGVPSAAFSPDGQEVVTASWDSTVRVWAVATGREFLTFTSTNLLGSAGFSPSGKRIVTWGLDHIARLWDADTGRELQALNSHVDFIHGAAFSPDSRRIVTGSADQMAKVWDAESGQELVTLKGHTSGVPAVAFSPDGERIVTGSWDGTARIWNAGNGREMSILKGACSQVNSLAFSPDGAWIVLGTDIGALLWDVPNDLSPGTIGGNRPTSPIGLNKWSSLALSPDGQRIVTGSREGKVEVWDLATSEKIFGLDYGTLSVIESVTYSPDGGHILAAVFDYAASAVKLLDAASGQELLSFRVPGDLASAAFSPDGRRIVTGGDAVKIWDATNGRELLTISEKARQVALSPDLHRIATGGHNLIKVWDAATGRELRTLQVTNEEFGSFLFSPDGQRILNTPDWRVEPAVWDAATGRELLTLRGGTSQSSLAFSQDGQRIITGGDQGKVMVWDAANGAALLTLVGVKDFIGRAAMSLDGRRIVASSYAGTVKFWEAASPQQVLAWQEEDRTAAQTATMLGHDYDARSKREAAAKKASHLQSWLVLAPIPLATNQTLVEGLDVEEIQREAQLRPKEGETSTCSAGLLKWRAWPPSPNTDDFEDINFNRLVGQGTTQNVGYAVCYIRSASDRQGLQMLLNYNDAAKIYLNGKEIYKTTMAKGELEGRVSDVSLRSGLNVLVYKVAHGSGYWYGSIRLTDADENPVTGIEVTLDPGASGLNKTADAEPERRPSK